MIKIQNNTATRDPIPSFLIGLKPESLADLSWTDPALGVSDCKWLPEVDASPALGQFERYGAETLNIGNGVVNVVRAVVPWSAEEIAEANAAEAKRVQDECVYNTQKRLDTFAQTRNYDGILSACTYATSSVAQFAAEGQYCVNARDLTWSKLYQILTEVQLQLRPMPTGYADIEAELPVLEWPAS